MYNDILIKLNILWTLDIFNIVKLGYYIYIIYITGAGKYIKYILNTFVYLHLLNII